MSKKYSSVMLSSTFIDLEAHRKAARTILGRSGFHPEVMETNGPQAGKNVLGQSLQMVDNCSAYILILGARYGTPPDDPESNPDALSLTELEFNHAEKSGKPILVYEMSDMHPVPKGVRESDALAEKLEVFRLRARKINGKEPERVYEVFDSEADFISKLGPDVHALREAIEEPSLMQDFGDAGSNLDRLGLRAAPALAAVPNYPKSHEFVGRVKELAELSSWCSENDPKPMMVINAIGGTGKSILTWSWLEQHAPHERFAGRFWYSFYERGAEMSDFCRHALAYIEGNDPGRLPPQDFADRLVSALQSAPWLMVLDGVERLLVQYHSSNAAQRENERGQKPKDGRDPRETFSKEDGDLLHRLSDCDPSKLLLTTRMIPKALLNNSQDYISTVRPKQLEGLSDEDALAFMTDLKVRGDAERIQRFLRRECDNHPLTLGAIAGLVLEYPADPGNFDKWRNDPDHGGQLNLGELDLTNRQNHILSFAVGSLNDTSRKVLSQIALWQHGIAYATLRDTNPLRPKKPVNPNHPNSSLLSSKRMGESERKYHNDLKAWQNSDGVRNADAALTTSIKDLKRRGLLQFDESEKRYDLHPVVRSVAFVLTDENERKEVGQSVVDHLTSADRGPWQEAKSIADVEQGVDIVITYQILGEVELACYSLQGVLYDVLFRKLDALQHIEMLVSPFFPNGWLAGTAVEKTPNALFLIGAAISALRERDPSVALELGHQMLEKAFELDNVWLVSPNLDTYCALCDDNLAFAELNTLIEYIEKIRTLEEKNLASDLDALTGTDYQKYVNAIKSGQDERADLLYDLIDLELKEDRNNELFLMFLPWRIIHQTQRKNFRNDEIEKLTELVFTSDEKRTQELMYTALGEWHLAQENYKKAEENFSIAYRMAQESGRFNARDYACICLTKLRDGQEFDAKAIALALSNKPKALSVLPQIWKELGEHERAIETALVAHERYAGEGEPYVDRFPLIQIRALLEELGEPLPEIPRYDPKKHRPYHWEAAAITFIDRIEKSRAEKEEARKERPLPVVMRARDLLRTPSAPKDYQAFYDGIVKSIRKPGKGKGGKTIDWPFSPLVPGPWISLPSRKLSNLSAALSDASEVVLRELKIEAARAIKLPFYKDALLVEGAFSRAGKLYAIHRAILTCSEILPLNGRSEGIHELNRRILKNLDTVESKDYLRFYCSAVRGEEGRFRIIEEREPEIGLSEDIAVTRLEESMQDEDGDRQTFAATVLYSNAVFLAKFSVGSSGSVDMLDDDPIAADLDIKKELFDDTGRLQLLGETAPDLF